MIYHADMYSLPNFDKEILKHIKPGVVVSGTRIEPPLHPAGPEKVIKDFGIEPEEFQEQELLNWFDTEYTTEQETTEVYSHLGLSTKRISKRLVDTTHCMHHNQKRIVIYSIDLYWQDTK